MRLRFLSYRFAEAVLEAKEFGDLKREVLDVIGSAPVPLLDPDPAAPKGRRVKNRRRAAIAGGQPRHFFLPVDQKSLNLHLDAEFRRRDWSVHPRIIPTGSGGPETGLAADYKKGRLQVEVQFGNMARWYTDVFKFQLSYSRNEIDAAVLIVPVQHFANLIDENVAYFERVERELPWAKMSLTLPIWVIGIEPDEWLPLQTLYETAAERFTRARAEAGERVDVIGFDQRVVMSPDEEAHDTPEPLQ